MRTTTVVVVVVVVLSCGIIWFHNFQFSNMYGIVLNKQTKSRDITKATCFIFVVFDVRFKKKSYSISVLNKPVGDLKIVPLQFQITSQK